MGQKRAATGMEAGLLAKTVDKAWAPIPFLRCQWQGTFSPGAFRAVPAQGLRLYGLIWDPRGL